MTVLPHQLLTVGRLPELVGGFVPESGRLGRRHRFWRSASGAGSNVLGRDRRALRLGLLGSLQKVLRLAEARCVKGLRRVVLVAWAVREHC